MGRQHATTVALDLQIASTIFAFRPLQGEHRACFSWRYIMMGLTISAEAYMQETKINPSDADVADDVELTPAAAFLKEADELWPEVSQFYRFTVEGQEVGAFCLDDIQEDEEVGVSLITVRRTLTGAGYGTLMLNALCDLADKHDVALRLEILPTGRLTEQDLKSWYERRGFVPGTNPIFDGGPVMSRSPHAQLEDALTANLLDLMQCAPDICCTTKQEICATK